MSQLCEICGEVEAKYTCRLCGRRVCSKHFNSNRGICSVCEMSLCEICGEYLSISYCPICGRLGCSDCLIQLTPVVRVCRDCLNKYGRDKVLELLGLKSRVSRPYTRVKLIR